MITCEDCDQSLDPKLDGVWRYASGHRQCDECVIDRPRSGPKRNVGGPSPNDDDCCVLDVDLPSYRDDVNAWASMCPCGESQWVRILNSERWMLVDAALLKSAIDELEELEKRGLR